MSQNRLIILQHSTFCSGYCIPIWFYAKKRCTNLEKEFVSLKLFIHKTWNIVLLFTFVEKECGKTKLEILYSERRRSDGKQNFRSNFIVPFIHKANCLYRMGKIYHVMFFWLDFRHNFMNDFLPLSNCKIFAKNTTILNFTFHCIFWLVH